MFDPALADALAFATLPLEIIGIALTIVEIWFPAQAHKLADHIILIGKGRSQAMWRARKVRLLIEFTIFFFLGYAAQVTLFYHDHSTSLYVFLYFGSSVSLAYSIAAYLIHKKPLAGMGLLLASFGLMGELYQMITGFVS